MRARRVRRGAYRIERSTIMDAVRFPARFIENCQVDGAGGFREYSMKKFPASQVH